VDYSRKSGLIGQGRCERILGGKAAHAGHGQGGAFRRSLMALSCRRGNEWREPGRVGARRLLACPGLPPGRGSPAARRMTETVCYGDRRCRSCLRSAGRSPPGCRRVSRAAVPALLRFSEHRKPTLRGGHLFLFGWNTDRKLPEAAFRELHRETSEHDELVQNDGAHIQKYAQYDDKERLLAEGVAPSYFLEGMLYNVPDDKFGGTHADTWVKCFNWIITADRDNLLCANRLHWLVRDNSPTSWPIANFNMFTAAAKKYWES
jgi:hypothetical protein